MPERNVLNGNQSNLRYFLKNICPYYLAQFGVKSSFVGRNLEKVKLQTQRHGKVTSLNGLLAQQNNEADAKCREQV